MLTEERNVINENSDSYNHEAIIDKCVLDIIKRENYISFNVIKNHIDTKGGNYLGLLCEVDIKGETAEGPKVTQIFIKSLPPDHVKMELLSWDDVYNRENFIYFDLKKIYDELQDEARVPLEERYKIPKAYSVPLSNALFLENLTRQGFTTKHRMDIVTLDFAEKSLKELAKYHALSFVLQEKRPNYFNNNIRTLKSAQIFGQSWKEFVDKFRDITLKHLDTEVRNKIEDQIKSLTEKYSQYLTEECEIKCLCHGDYRPNNLLMKEVDGKVSELIPVDYQLTFYTCPVLDIIYFIYSSTDFEFRQNHLQHLKEHYYDSFKEFLGYFGLSADTVFSKKQFDRLFEEKSDYGLMMFILLGPFMFTSEDNVPDLKKDTISDWDLKMDDRFSDRLDGVIKEFLLI